MNIEDSGRRHLVVKMWDLLFANSSSRWFLPTPVCWYACTHSGSYRPLRHLTRVMTTIMTMKMKTANPTNSCLWFRCQLPYEKGAGCIVILLLFMHWWVGGWSVEDVGQVSGSCNQSDRSSLHTSTSLSIQSTKWDLFFSSKSIPSKLSFPSSLDLFSFGRIRQSSLNISCTHGRLSVMAICQKLSWVAIGEAIAKC